MHLIRNISCPNKLGNKGWAIILWSLGKLFTWITAQVEGHHCSYTSGKKAQELLSWVVAEGKLTAGQSQSSCGPERYPAVLGETLGDLLGLRSCANTSLQWGTAQSSQILTSVTLRGLFLVPHISPTHLSVCPKVWPLPVGKCKGTWCEHVTDAEWNFFDEYL